MPAKSVLKRRIRSVRSLMVVRIMVKRFILGASLIVMTVGLIAGCAGGSKEDVGDSPATRTVYVSYSFDVAGLPDGAGEVRVWVPHPTQSEDQDILDMRIVKSPSPTSVNYDSEWGNGIIYFETDGSKKEFSFAMDFIVKRTEVVKDMTIDASSNHLKGDNNTELLGQYLKPSKLVVQNERVSRYSKAAVEGRGTSELDRARGIYDFTLENMDYNKKIPGWGKGDVNRVCLAIGEGKRGTGNCTDFHSFFGSLMRSQNIPVVFEMGFPLKEIDDGSTVTVEGGYHCWAKFFVPGKGWVPVDISEADKNPSKKEYYFGSICENRLSFSRGRDILLVPQQKGERLNFFGPDPYIEVDGVPFIGFTRTINYKDG